MTRPTDFPQHPENPNLGSDDGAGTTAATLEPSNPWSCDVLASSQRQRYLASLVTQELST